MEKINPSHKVQLNPEGTRRGYPMCRAPTSRVIGRGRINQRLGVQRLRPSTIDFDHIGVDASIANAPRRILIANVEMITIKKVFVWQNTSVMQDKVLAARLGLVPVRIHPGRLETWERASFLPSSFLIVWPRAEDVGAAEATATDANTISFQLQVSCTRCPGVPSSETDPSKLYENSTVYSSHMLWQPVGQQGHLPDWVSDPPAVAAPDIVILKLRPGQEVHAELHCVKACGREHAKWSPVATATYRLMPHIDIVSPIPERLQQKFVESFSPGVIGRRKAQAGKGMEVYVKDARRDTVSRNVFMHPEFEGCVKLGRVRDHFLFTVESAGQIPPQALLPEAIAVSRRKIKVVSSALGELIHPSPAAEEGDKEAADDEVEEGAGMDVDL
ncbi:RBP11-like subunits of RNA polymerase [Calocera viscosa TUFC12733]|uniref:RBP11-like subunits of RNA polymerase n=1 Tax=Calocera viscosa (strain TUFC12733) TaxID=1330018 RepID=A0A167ICV1_CALVF|nr:RBP11-like subunits of RNA polymerase [Calocera viscosa TUFC12733]